MEFMEKEIREFILSVGVDDVGFARTIDYNSPTSYEITKFLPAASSIIVLAFKVLSSCESPSLSVALNGYLDLGAFARESSYRVARFLENKFGAKVATIPLSHPYEIHNDRVAIADINIGKPISSKFLCIRGLPKHQGIFGQYFDSCIIKVVPVQMGDQYSIHLN